MHIYAKLATTRVAKHLSLGNPQPNYTDSLITPVEYQKQNNNKHTTKTQSN